MSVNCFRIEYEILPAMNQWTTFIAAFSHEEAVKQLRRIVKKEIRITASGMQCRLDDLSVEVRQNVINAFLRTQNDGLVGEPTQEKKPSIAVEAKKAAIPVEAKEAPKRRGSLIKQK